jgi:transposase
MLLVDGRGLPLSAMTVSANVAEVNTVETLLDLQVAGGHPERLIYDRAVDADWLRYSLQSRGIEMICPHRRGRKRPALQDGRSLRRYRHRWIIERSISWLSNCRRLLIRHEYHAHLFEGFVFLACLLIVLRQF